MSKARAFAHTNIALIKYWGKRSSRSLNLPATGSLSLTLDAFGTETTVETRTDSDTFVLDGTEVQGSEAERTFAFLNLIAPQRPPCAVTSFNRVPTAAGLASSASAFAALAVAGTAALEVKLAPKELSILARRGSGSAARSIFGGLVHMHRGELDDGSDSFAERIPSQMDLALVVVRCATGRKKVGSTEGMERTASTSPYYAGWLQTHAADLDTALQAISQNDLAGLGAVMEHSTLKMHASALAAKPGLWYLAPTTLAVMGAVRQLQEDGANAWFTMDAGPHVKVLTDSASAPSIAETMREIDGVKGVDIAHSGGPARLLDDDERCGV